MAHNIKIDLALDDIKYIAFVLREYKKVVRKQNIEYRAKYIISYAINPLIKKMDNAYKKNYGN